jgi:hypothetical protein
MAPRDKDEMNDLDDDLPIMADDDQVTEQTEGDDVSDDADLGEEYDALADMAEDEKYLLSLMSEEELAALRGEEHEEGEDGDNDAAVALDDAAATQGDPAAQADAGKAAQPAPVELTADQLAQIDARVKAARSAAMAQWRDGDLTDEELDEAMEAADALRHTAKAELEQQAQAQLSDQEFEQFRQAFLAEAKSYLTTDYPLLASADHMAGFDRHVLSVTANPIHASKTPRQMLDLARKLYVAEVEGVLDVTALRDKGKPDTPKQDKQPAPAPAKPKSEVVPTLARVPAAATNATSDGKYGALQAAFDRADAAGKEAIMARLSPEEAEAFASMDA